MWAQYLIVIAPTSVSHTLDYKSETVQVLNLLIIQRNRKKKCGTVEMPEIGHKNLNMLL